MIKVEQEIVSYAVIKPETPQPIVQKEREQVLTGKTYKIAKSHLSDSALYVTLNDYEGLPFEIFLNSKETRHQQWIVALTRVISAVFRKGGDCTFLIEELKSIHDPKGGYFRKGHYVPSLVSEIGEILEQHFTGLGLYKKDESLAVASQEMVKEKIEKKKNKDAEKKGLLCDKCGEYRVVMLDGCHTCQACGSSRCG